MSKPKTAQELLHCKNYGEVVRELKKEPGLIRIEVKNSTVKFYGKSGMVPVHNHPSQQPPFGTLRNIVRMAVIAGIVLGLLILWGML